MFASLFILVNKFIPVPLNQVDLCTPCVHAAKPAHSNVGWS